MPGQPEPRLHPLNIQDFLRTDTKNISDFLIPVFIIPLPYRPSPDILPMWRNRCRQGSLWVCFSKGCVGVGLYQRSKAEQVFRNLVSWLLTIAIIENYMNLKIISLLKTKVINIQNTSLPNYDSTSYSCLQVFYINCYLYRGNTT